jgi:shikimate dehydrogenase
MPEPRILRDAVNRGTTLCLSLAARPSNLGTRFHNFLYDELGLDFLYKACTTTDVAAAVAGIRALGIRGCGMSMPFKEAVIPLVDEVEPSAAVIGSVNTIVNDDGVLRASNTDYLAVATLLGGLVDRTELDPATSPVAVAGSGGMAKAVVAALRDGGWRDVTVVARTPATGRALAEQYDTRWAGSLSDERPALLVNATPVGMAVPDPAGDDAAEALPFPEAVVDAATAVFEVVAVPARTPLVRRATERGLPVVTGVEVSALQALEQFVRYTGVRPTDDQVARATAFSRA